MSRRRRHHHHRRRIFLILSLGVISLLLFYQFRFVVLTVPSSSSTSSSSTRNDNNYDSHNDRRRSTSSSTTTSSSRWGICDPRTVSTTYRPNGTIVLVSFAGWKSDRKMNMMKLKDDIIQIFHNNDDHDDHENDFDEGNEVTTTTTTAPKQQRRRRQQWHVKTLLYTEDDLPNEYYEEFAWAFPGRTVTNNNNNNTNNTNINDRRYDHQNKPYRRRPRRGGYWTWKPWILWNITTTNMVQRGDVVLWVDSDLRLWVNEPYHLQTAICNIEHRNPTNYGGMFPFVRCRGHPEMDYTKPTLFDMMMNERMDTTTISSSISSNDNVSTNVNISNNNHITVPSNEGVETTALRKDDRTEQIYAGVLGIHIRDDTLSFLQEWKEWGRIPLAFGDGHDNDVHNKNNIDRPSSKAVSSQQQKPNGDGKGRPVRELPPTYKEHKNDQSVLSLLVKRYNMKVWPVPYLLLGESGIWTPGICWNRYADAGYCAFIDKGRHEKTMCRFYNWWIKTTKM